MASADQTSGGEPAKAAWRDWQRWLRLRGGWLAGTLLCVVLATALAVMLPLRVDIDRPAQSLFDWRWWIEPIETNAFARRPAIDAYLRGVAIAPDGRTALAAGLDGTLLRSGDAGITWLPVADIPKKNLYRVAFASDGRVALAAGTAGTLLRSINSGTTWLPIAADTQQDLFGIVFAPDGRLAMAAGVDGTLLRSVDAGATWRVIATDTQRDLFGVVFAPDGRIALAAGGGGTLLRSVDAGITWQSVVTGTQQDLTGVAFAPNGRIALAAGESGTLLRSVDAGTTWLPIASGTQQDLYSVFFAPDGSTALAAGVGGTLLRSIDFGANWQTIAADTKEILFGVVFAPDGRTAFAAGLGGTLLRSGDAGVSWQPVADGTQRSLFGVAFSADGTTLAVGAGGMLLRTIDADATWQPVAVSTRQDLHSAVFAPDGRTALAAGQDGMLLRSVDAGATWESVITGTQRSLFGVVFASDGRTALATGRGGTLLRSVDAGATWQQVTAGTQLDLIGVVFASDGRTALATGRGGTLLRSVDAGVTWRVVVADTQRDLFGVVFAPNGRIALAVGDNGMLLRSIDAGATWRVAETGTQRDLLGVVFAPDGRTALAVGLGGTLLRSIDFGATWRPVDANTQMDLVGVVFTSDGLTAFVVGMGGTLLRSANAGISWRTTHRTSPAPVVWALLLAAVALAASLFVPPPPETFPRDKRSVTAATFSSLFVTDRPLQPSDVDAAGATAFASRICRFLINKRTQPPLTLAITGDWGSGKSSVLNLLAASLNRSGRSTVWFNAWHHQKEEHIFAALLQAVRKQAVPSLATRAGLALRSQLAGSRIRRHWPFWFGASLLFAAFSGAMSATGSAALTDFWQSLVVPSGLVATLLAGAYEFRDRLKSSGLDPGKLMSATSRALRRKDLGGQLAFRVRFAEALREITTALGNTNLTIIIDDLDRCDPRAVAEAMEAINFLTSSCDCFVILAIARAQVLKAMGLAHAEMASEMAPEGWTDERAIRDHYAQRYLDKLIQIEMPVPSFDGAAAERLTRATTLLRDTFPNRALLTPLAAVGIAGSLLVAGIGGHIGGQLLSSTRQPIPTAASFVTTAVTTTNTAALTQTSTSLLPADRPQQNRPEVTSTVGVIEYRKPATPWQDSRLLMLPLPLVLAAIAAGIYFWRRTAPIDEDDAPTFAAALSHWSTAAFLARPSPRELKRFLNRLRLATSAPGVAADAITVGLAVLCHVDREAMEIAAKNGIDPLQAILERDKVKARPELQAEIRRAAQTMSAVGHEPFAPDPEKVKTFLAAWTGFTIRA